MQLEFWLLAPGWPSPAFCEHLIPRGLELLEVGHGEVWGRYEARKGLEENQHFIATGSTLPLIYVD